MPDRIAPISPDASPDNPANPLAQPGTFTAAPAYSPSRRQLRAGLVAVLLLVLLFLQLPCLHLKLLRSVLLLGTLCRRASRIGTLCCAHRTPKQ